MKEDAIISLLERLGCKKIRKRGNEIGSSCPFPANHRHGDRNPSFGVLINDSDRSPYNCFACGVKGTAEGLAFQNGFEDLVGEWKPKRIKEANIVSLCNQERKVDPVFFEDRYLEQFENVFFSYFNHRGIDIDTGRTFELKFDRQSRRAIFVLRDISGKIGSIIGRDVTGNSKAKYTYYCLDKVSDTLKPFPDKDRRDDFVCPLKRFFLYGENIAYQDKDSDLFVVEGPIDALMLHQYGFRSVAVLGSAPSRQQCKTMKRLVRRGRIVVAGDGDEAGRKLPYMIKKELRHERIHTIRIPDGMDPGSISRDIFLDLVENISILGLKKL